MLLMLLRMRVLILVIAVDGLGELKRDYRKELLRAGLNPCYSGRWSRRV